MNRFYRVSHYLGSLRLSDRLGHSRRISPPHSAGRVRFACCSSSRALARPFQARAEVAPLALPSRMASQATFAGAPLSLGEPAFGLTRPADMGLLADRRTAESGQVRQSVRECLAWHVKRLLDTVIASVALVALSPVMVLSALAIRRESRGPVLYSQVRVGLDRRQGPAPSMNGSERRRLVGYGRPFKIYKFRSMVQGAERGTGPVWCSNRDPRITKVGSFLRRTHLDELPQLVNVLRGEMSIVGPRPERPEFVERLATEIPGYRQRSAVLPGITGLAQVKYRYTRDLQSAATKLLYDLYYVRNGGLLLDVKIMAATVGVMARPDSDD
jgi:lipopolysaccharide/colanic/teichoic acid biosynthesis glycosyltransferase